MTFSAILVEKNETGPAAEVTSLEESRLPDGDVSVDVEYSTLNYKDGLAVTGSKTIVREFPMVPGIDLAGVVTESTHSSWRPGDRVVLNGWGVGENRWGGLAQRARVNGDWLVPLPSGFSTRQAMAIGTAGYTASLCVDALTERGVRPDEGEVLVTGATGGVGSIAIALLTKAGFQVAAMTGKSAETEYLHRLGAATVVNRDEFGQAGKPLQKERWAGVIDAVGSHTLANACAQTRYGGTVVACGLAGGMDFPASVAPFILRGVGLVGIDSVMAPMRRRLSAWDRLAQDLDGTLLEVVAEDVSLAEAIDHAQGLLAGNVRGRIVVDVNR